MDLYLGIPGCLAFASAVSRRDVANAMIQWLKFWDDSIGGLLNILFPPSRNWGGSLARGGGVWGVPEFS